MVNKRRTGGKIRPVNSRGHLEDDVSIGMNPPVLKSAPLGVLAAMGLWAAVLSGCSTKASADAAAEPQAAKVEQADSQVTKVKQTDSGFPVEFTTEGKPTKTIETPFGDHELYDFYRDPQIVEYYNNFFEADTAHQSNTSKDMITLNELIVRPAFNTSLLDYYRIGCIKVVDSYCSFHAAYLDPVCDIQKTLGTPELSECEQANITKFGHGMGGTAVYRGKEYCEPAPSVENLSSANEFLQKQENLSCELWMGEETDTYWNTLLIYGPKRKSTYPQRK